MSRRRPEERRAERAAVTDPAVVLEAAARYLARPHSISDTRRHLVGAGYSSSLVEQAVTRLVELHLLDDGAYARAWIASRDRTRPRGERVLRQELRMRGVAAEVIDEALDDRVVPAADARSGDGWHGRDPEDEPEPRDDARNEPELDADEAAAERLIRRRARTLANVTEPRVRRERAYALLARNGFDADVCRDVASRVEALLGEP